MEVTTIIQSIFSNTIVAFIILIGIVIFVHEFGHFLAGKLFGIYVEEFSIGFGPKAIGFKRGRTEYKINWLPLGGYVRFYGADIEEKIPIELQERSILHAKVYKRAIVSFAGPFANFVLSFFVIAVLCVTGIPHVPSIISVLPESVAMKAGLKTGDKIIAVNNEEVNDWGKFSSIVSNSPNKEVQIRIDRNNKILNYSVIPAAESVETIFGNSKISGRIGVSATFNSSHIVVEKDTLFSAIGIATGNKIAKINDIKIDYLFQISQALESIFSKYGIHSEVALAQEIVKIDSTLPKLTISVVRLNDSQIKNEKLEHIVVDFSSHTIQNWAKNYLKSNVLHNEKWEDNFLSSDQTIQNFSTLKNNDKALAAQDAWKKCGLKPGDTLYSIDNKGRIYSYMQFSSYLESLSKVLTPALVSANPLVPIYVSTLSQNGVLNKLMCHIPVSEGLDSLNRQYYFISFPVTFLSKSEVMPPFVLKAKSFVDVVQRSYFYVQNQISLTYNGVKMLVTGSIPLANLGGPIAIANAAGDAAKDGLLTFLLMMSFISTNIGFMNLLPLPALDGGALFLQSIEAAYGKPLPKSVQLAVQRAGIFVIFLLFILVFYNDILRLIR